MDWTEDILYDLKNKNLLRTRRVIKGLKDFCSNDYLGLRDHPRVVKAAKDVLETTGLGSGASQLVSGYTEHHKALEEKLAEFKEIPSCLLFGSGYLANLGAIPVLAGEEDLILSDELNHASLIDGCRFSKAERFVFKHKDYKELKRFLQRKRQKHRRALIVTDSVFSMEGDLADLKELIAIANEFNCLLYIDDAHATGTIGEGKGALHHFDLEWQENIVVMGTLSKALGSYGAFVCADEKLVELLLNKARSLIFTTSIPPSLCAGALESLKIIEEKPSMIEELREKGNYIYKLLKELPYDIKYNGTPIIPIIVGDEGEALRLSAGLLERGIFLQAIRYPTVPKGKARLRLTVSLRHSLKDIDRLMTEFEELTR